uniref:Uncharacterized protein LOC103453197 n=1 Tax=Rhizophora mucronata TaxID=61149 RepID=A0A2P2PIH4_RHIMU
MERRLCEKTNESSDPLSFVAKMEAAGGKSAAAARFKRENCTRTKHDSEFSKWQVLIGPTDWEDHSQGKEGASRYRIHNLPPYSGSGLYELGIALARSKSGRDVGKLDPDDIVVVYLGQADNVRTRIQHYGRSGAHLSSSFSSGYWTGDHDSKTDSPNKGHGLFEEFFSRGFSIVFRWAPMKDKKDSVKTEARLLDTFDYAWNKGSNGIRRPGDIIQKLEKIASSTNRFPKIANKLLFFREGQVGIKIKRSMPTLPDSAVSTEEDSKNFLSGIFKLSRTQPRLVSDKRVIDENSIHICGFITNDGITCGNPPVPGRKRCEEHKGRRIYGSRDKSTTGSSSNPYDIYWESGSHDDQDCSTPYTACGVKLADRTFCGKQPVPGRKRCEEHKGMRVNSSMSKTIPEEKCHMPAFSSIFTTSDACVKGTASSSTNAYRDHGNEQCFTVCGATLGNGSFCQRQPIRGNKRCWQHKGKRVDSTFSEISSSFMKFDSFTCGVTLQNGSVCMRAPPRGRKRCEQHKGMRVTA